MLAEFSTLPNAADLNFYHALVGHARCIAKGQARVEAGQILTHCGMSVSYFNNHFILDPALLQQREWLMPVEFFSAPKKLDYLLVLPEAWAAPVENQILAQGFQLETPTPAMIFDAEKTPLQMPASYGQMEIRLVDDVESYDAFKKVGGQAFGMPDFVVERIMTADFLADPQNRLFVGLVQGEPVSTSLLTLSHGVAGIYWVATEKSRRGKGYGEALAYHATKVGMESGQRFMSLQATALGAPVYSRMGYQTLYHYRRYLKKQS